MGPQGRGREVRDDVPGRPAVEDPGPRPGHGRGADRFTTRTATGRGMRAGAQPEGQGAARGAAAAAPLARVTRAVRCAGRAPRCRSGRRRECGAPTPARPRPLRRPRRRAYRKVLASRRFRPTRCPASEGRARSPGCRGTAGVSPARRSGGSRRRCGNGFRPGRGSRPDCDPRSVWGKRRWTAATTRAATAIHGGGAPEDRPRAAAVRAGGGRRRIAGRCRGPASAGGGGRRRQAPTSPAWAAVGAHGIRRTG